MIKEKMMATFCVRINELMFFKKICNGRIIPVKNIFGHI